MSAGVVVASPLAAAFARAKAKGSRALVCYLVAGDPDLDASLRLHERLICAGADVVELGLPFSDPIADGPVLQAAALRALQGGMTVARALELASRMRGAVPMVAMGYYNPILAFGLDRFAEQAAAAGLVGAIIPDLPHEEAQSLRSALEKNALDWIPLVAPTTSPERLVAVTAGARGFVYYVSVTGVTGARTALPPQLAERLAQVRKISPAPVAVGFGVSTPAQAAALAPLADGVVVGSALVQRFHALGAGAEALDECETFVRELKAALSISPRSIFPDR